MDLKKIDNLSYQGSGYLKPKFRSLSLCLHKKNTWMSFLKLSINNYKWIIMKIVKKIHFEKCFLLLHPGSVMLFSFRQSCLTKCPFIYLIVYCLLLLFKYFMSLSNHPIWTKPEPWSPFLVWSFSCQTARCFPIQ